MDLDAGHSDDGAHFLQSKGLRRYVNTNFRAFGIALIRCIYSKPHADERRRWQSTSGFPQLAAKFRLQSTIARWRLPNCSR
jgi:hypothetical protein